VCRQQLTHQNSNTKTNTDILGLHASKFCTFSNLRTERFRKRDHFAPSGETVESQYTATFDRTRCWTACK